MRIEATINDLRGQQLEAVQEELGLSKSQTVDEALGFLFEVLAEVRKGRHVAIMDNERKVTELRMPSFGLAQWVKDRERIVVSKESFDALTHAVDHPREPSERLKKRLRRTAKK